MMMNNQTLDMTKGNALKLIISFSIPLMIGSIFQQFYTIVDTAIVGKGIGVSALASIGAADWLVFFGLSMALGFTQGFGIEIAQTFGAKNYKKLNDSIMQSFILSVLLSVFLTIMCLLMIRPVLHLLNTPSEVINGSIDYLTIYFSGIIIMMMYNLQATILRSLGNSKDPLIGMIIGSICNVILDIIVVFVFHFGIKGAAIATVFSQFVASIYCFIHIKKIDIIHFEFHINLHYWIRLLKLGLPVAFQNMVIALGGVIVQRIVNSYGMLFIAGYTATNKLYGLLELAAISFGYGISTYCGQNLGAGNIERIKKGVKDGIKVNFIMSVCVSLLMIVFGRNILGLFLNKTEVVSLGYAYSFLKIMAIYLFILYLLHLYRNALQGMGNTIMPMVSGIIELIMRISSVFILPYFIGELGVFYAEVLAWFGAFVILSTSYYRDIKKLEFK